MTDMELRQNRAASRRIVFTAIPMLLLLAAFAFYAWNGSGRLLTLVASAAMLLLYCFAVIRLIPQWQRAWSGDPLTLPERNGSKRSLRPSRMHPFAQIVLAACISRLVLFLAVYLIHWLQHGYQGGMVDLLSLWMPAETRCTDWLQIAAQWYPASGELFTLFPFYPAAVRTLALVFGDPLTAHLLPITAMVLSTICFSFSAWLIYELTLFDADRETAMTAARWFCLLPLSLLLMQPTADGLFLLLSLCCMVMTRRKKYIAAALFGMVAAFTRAAGAILILPICIELVADFRNASSEKNHMVRSNAWMIGRCAALLLVPLGTALWCLLCAGITGNPFSALAENFGFFFASAAQQIVSILSAVREQAASSAMLHAVRLACYVVPLLLLIAVIPRFRTSYAAYLLLYIALTYGAMPQDLPRLIVSAFPLCPLFATAIRRRFPRALVTILMFAGLAVAAVSQAMRLPIF